MLAEKLDAFAIELESSANASAAINDAQAAKAAIASNGQTLPNMGEFSGKTQTAAVIKALARGPQTTRQLYQLLNHNGQSFRKATYITALLPRLKDKVERTADGKKLKLKETTK